MQSGKRSAVTKAIAICGALEAHAINYYSLNHLAASGTSARVYAARRASAVTNEKLSCLGAGWPMLCVARGAGG